MISSTSEVMAQIWEQAPSMPSDNDLLTDLMETYSRESKERDTLFSSLVKVYEK